MTESDAHTDEDVRRIFETTFAAAGKAVVHHASATPVAPDLAKAVAAALGKKEATAEEVATAYRLELVAGSARSLWLRVGAEKWVHLDNPTDAIQALVQAAFCPPAQLQVVVRYRSDLIVDLVVQSKEAPSEEPRPSP